MVSEYFSPLGQVELFAPPLPPATKLSTADILLVRTVTQVDIELLHNSNIKFVGTASSGMNHINCNELEANGINCASAAGCNAQAVAEYVLSAVSGTLSRQGRELSGLKVGIIGHGNIGKKLEAMLRMTGAHCLLNDPPLAACGQSGYVPLTQALQADIISIHVPLTKGGTHPTLNLIDHDAIQSLPYGSIVVNTSRGEVIDEPSLCARAAQGELTAILDVWQNEPSPKQQHIKAAAVATPHIAGYSNNAKYRAVAMLAQQAASFYRRPQIESFMPPCNPDNEPYFVSGYGTTAIADAAATVCDPYHDSSFMHNLTVPDDDQRAKLYSNTRNLWPLRLEFRQQRLQADNIDTYKLLAGLGFQLAAAESSH
ncbi:MAG: 4-phosphoerythronate dehydrogenase [Candidatus Porifericomitaceae bacterium WSBS_2022_MAG_OTU9]